MAIPEHKPSYGARPMRINATRKAPKNARRETMKKSNPATWLSSPFYVFDRHGEREILYISGLLDFDLADCICTRKNWTPRPTSSAKQDDSVQWHCKGGLLYLQQRGWTLTPETCSQRKRDETGKRNHLLHTQSKAKQSKTKQADCDVRMSDINNLFLNRVVCVCSCCCINLYEKLSLGLNLLRFSLI